MDQGDYYSPSEAARILSRSGQRIGERRVRQMCADGEIAGAEQTESGRWRIPQATVHKMLEERREREQLLREPEGVLAVPERAASEAMLERLLEAERRAARLEGRMELTEQAESTLRRSLEREQRRGDRLELELREARARLEEARARPWWRRLFRG